MDVFKKALIKADHNRVFYKVKVACDPSTGWDQRMAENGNVVIYKELVVNGEHWPSYWIQEDELDIFELDMCESCFGDGVVSYDNSDYIAVEHDCFECEGTGKM